MAGPVRISILANASQATRAFGQVESRASRMARGLKTAAVGGLLIAGAAAAKFGVDSVKAASDAQQSLGATEQVFGKFAKTVIDRSNQASRAVGISANEYRELNNVLGASLSAAGVPLGKTADLTDKLTTRAADLAATFGGTTREAIEAVSSLLRGEADPIERYGVSIKQSDVSARLAAKGLDNLTGSARKSAEMQARLDLLFGQTARSAGQFGRESDTIAGKTQRLGARFEDIKARVGTLLLPALVDLAGVAERRLVPALEKGVTWFEQNKDEIAATGTAIGDSLLPPLRTLAGVAQSVIGFVSGLPEPIRNLGIQAAAAGLILPRLNSAVTTVSGAMTTARNNTTGLVSSLRSGQGRLAAFRGAAGGLAGTAGLMGLAASSQTSNRAISVLGSTASGALLGFSLGGPIGAAIGGGAGALLGFATSADRAAESTKKAEPPAADYAATLRGLSGAATKATRAEAYRAAQQKGVLGISNQLGIASRDLVGAVLGEEDATRRVGRAWRERASALDAAEQGKFSKFLRDETGSLARSRREVQESTRATQSWGQALKGLPQDVRTRLRMVDYNPTRRQLQNIIRDTGGLNRRQTRILVREFGAGRVRRTLGGLQRDLRNTGRTSPNLGPWSRVLHSGVRGAGRGVQRGTRGIDRDLRRTGQVRPTTAPWLRGLGAAIRLGQSTAQRGTGNVTRSLSRGTTRARPDLSGYNSSLGRLLSQGNRVAQRGGQGVADSLRRGTSRARPELGGFNSGISAGIGSARGIASSGGNSVGSALRTGVISGFSGTQTALANSAAAAVRAAVAAARAAADSRSPSRKMARAGREMAQGLDLGFSREAKRSAVNAKKFALALLAASTGGLSEVIRRIKAHGEAEKRRASVINAAVKAVKRSSNALVANARAQQVNTDKVSSARSRLQDLINTRNQYAASVRDSLLSYASVSSVEEGHLNSTSSFLEGLRERAAQATRFASLMESLKRRGLNQTSLRQLLDAGPEAGRAAAESLAAGGTKVITEVNRLTSDLSKAGQTLGNSVGAKFYNAGISSAQSLVRGLERRGKDLDRAANRIATRMTRIINKRLGGIRGNVGLPTQRVAQRQAIRPESIYVRRQTQAQVVKVKLTGAQTTAIQRGKEISLDLKAFQRAGGRA